MKTSHTSVMTNKFTDVNKGTRVFFTNIKHINLRLTNKMSMQRCILYFRKTLESREGLGAGFKRMYFKRENLLVQIYLL